MSQIKASEAQVLFFCSGCDSDTFCVAEYVIRDEISFLYEVELVLHSSNHSIAVEEMVHTRATVLLNREDEYYPYSGIVISCSYIETTVDYSTYTLSLRPHLWLLTQTSQSRNFRNMTVAEIVKQILDETGLETCYTLSLKESYPSHEYVVQYQESDLNFISRLMEEEGLWYIFKETPLLREELDGSPGQEQLCITDEGAAFEAIHGADSIRYRARNDMVAIVEDDEVEHFYEMEQCRRLIPEHVMVRNYNYRTPEVDIAAHSPVVSGDRGFVYHYGGSFKTVDEAEHAAVIAAKRIALTRTTMEAKSYCKGLRAGRRVTVKEHHRDDLNQEYLISRVYHRGKITLQMRNTYAPAYDNECSLIPFDIGAHYSPPLTASTPRMSGVMNATIEGDGGQYATIDEQGRYKIRMGFDRSGSPTSQASKPIRMAQVYSGAGYGIHLPSHEKAEMIVCHINGDPSKPIGLGTIPNADAVTPVKNGNNYESAIKTAGGNQIVLDDTAGSQKMSMSTPHNQCFFCGNDQVVSISADRRISVTNNETKVVTTDQEASIDGNQTVSVSGRKEESAKGSRHCTIGGNKSETTSADRLFSITAADEEKISGNLKVEVCGDNATAVNAVHHLQVEGDIIQYAGSSALTGSKSMVTMQADGDITMEGNTAILSGKATITLLCGGSSIIITPASIMITAQRLTISGGEVTLAGGTVNAMTGGFIKLN